MKKETFDRWTEAHHDLLEEIRLEAHRLHDSVNQHYGGELPYGYHLDMVAGAVMEYGYEVCSREEDILPMLFGAWFHDSIEDARQTYNDVRRTALRFMDAEQALMATEIVYALTNEKGRTRAERADERYYQGIRQTPYAPLIKLADRLANISFSCRSTDEANCRMRRVYRQELPHFLSSIHSPSPDPRLHFPQEMAERITGLVNP